MGKKFYSSADARAFSLERVLDRAIKKERVKLVVEKISENQHYRLWMFESGRSISQDWHAGYDHPEPIKVLSRERTRKILFDEARDLGSTIRSARNRIHEIKSFLA